MTSRIMTKSGEQEAAQNNQLTLFISIIIRIITATDLNVHRWNNFESNSNNSHTHMFARQKQVEKVICFLPWAASHVFLHPLSLSCG